MLREMIEVTRNFRDDRGCASSGIRTWRAQHDACVDLPLVHQTAVRHDSVTATMKLFLSFVCCTICSLKQTNTALPASNLHWARRYTTDTWKCVAIPSAAPRWQVILACSEPIRSVQPSIFHPPTPYNLWFEMLQVWRHYDAVCMKPRMHAELS